jgi:signal transduction histidine kinase
MRWSFALPFAEAGSAKAALPFNLSRWFALVGLVSIAVVGTASALLLSHLLTERMLRQEGVMTMQFVQSLVRVEQSLAEYFIGGTTNDEGELKSALEHIAAMPSTLRANVYNRDRVLIWSTDQKLVGRQFGANEELDEALAGNLVVHGDADDSSSKEEHVDLKQKTEDYFVEVYVPVRDLKGQIISVIELYKNPQHLAEALSTGRVLIFSGAAAAGLFLYLALFWLARRADRVIRTQQERLVENEILATVGEMGSAVAHGIRNPLAAIRSSAELALDAPAELARESAQDIIAEADRLEEWVRNLLSYSRPVAAAPDAVALPSLVKRTIGHFAREMEKRGISGRCSLAEDLPLAKGDPLLLGQVLHSLVANAVEAIQHGGQIEIGAQTVPDKKRVEVVIRDNGRGMSAEQLKRAFTPFYTTKPAGLGVGLALAKRIIERFGGSIVINSTPGCGTAVHVSMPVA